MNKHDFLSELLRSLSRLPENERDKAYAFYAEIIDDSMEDGMSEEEAVRKLGGMDEIVERIVSEVPITVLLKSRAERKNSGRFTILLLILGFPLWFPILISALCVLLVLFIIFWTTALVLWSVFAAAVAAAIGGCAGFVVFPGLGMKMTGLGLALACAGCSLPLYLASLTVTREFARLTNQLWKRMKNYLFTKRGGRQ